MNMVLKVLTWGCNPLTGLFLLRRYTILMYNYRIL